ncbi:MAG: 4Fe-4S cluster-binding domain-containing protein [Anaerocolumna sp.]
MYTITLEINQKCNLCCNYCYLGELTDNTMSSETAVKSIDMAFANVKSHRDNKLWFHFVGGEILLDFKLLQNIVSYIKERNVYEQKILTFSLTTNATLFSQDIMDWLTDNDFIIKVSIDGDKETNDSNRISKSGYSVYDKILDNWHYIKDYEEKCKRYVQVTNVITKNNYMNYFYSLRYMVEELGIKIIDTALDLTVSWDEVELSNIKEGIRGSFAFYMDSVRNHKEFYWNFMNELKHSVEKKKIFYTCGAGLITHYIRTDGKLFACTACLDKEYSLGDIDKGLYLDKINFLKEVKEIHNKSCTACSLYDYCGAKSCIMTSLRSNGDINRPNDTLCRMEQFMYGFYQEMKNK